MEPIEHKPQTFVYFYSAGKKLTKAEAARLERVRKPLRTLDGLLSFFKRGTANKLRPIRIRRANEPLVVYGNAEAVYTDSEEVKKAYEQAGVPVQPINKKAKENGSINESDSV